MSDGDSQRNLDYLMGTLGSTQYHAALAVSGAWKGTGQDKIHNEMGWKPSTRDVCLETLCNF